MLNYLWGSFILVAVIAGFWQFVFFDDPNVLRDIIEASFNMAKLSAEIAIGLIGVLSLWLGLFKVAEAAGVIRVISRWLSPFFNGLMPDVPKNHPAMGSMTMNLAANMLGLDNAATPLGLKAMQDLQSLNNHSVVASNAQILFLVLNTSSVTLLPVTIFMYRAQMGAEDPAAVFLPILMATACSTLVGLFAVAWVQRIPVYKPVILAYLLGFAFLLSLLGVYVSHLSQQALLDFSSMMANGILLLVIAVFIAVALLRKVKAYEVFVDGAKEGFSMSIRLIPYLVAMLVAIGMLRASGVIDGLLWLIKQLLKPMLDSLAFVDALPVAFMKPFSGSGSRALMLENMEHYGVDSFQGLLSAVMQGSTETTFYVLAVYFGAVGVTKVRHAVACGLLADFAGMLAAIFISIYFFSP
ncbi:MAG: hypothetical protein MI976_25260 [Pseudomonadales bacterium]|nr:hypothetical protein [Pseudomonadales bacterium]